jgi:hypothetical protein
MIKSGEDEKIHELLKNNPTNKPPLVSEKSNIIACLFFLIYCKQD